MNLWTVLQQRLERYEKKPRFLLGFIIGIHALVAAFHSVQLAKLLVWDVHHNMAPYLFAIVGSAFIYLGLPLIWYVLGLGWMLLFLGNTAFILHALRNFLLHRTLQDFSIGHNIAGISIHIALVRILLFPYVFRVFAHPNLRRWARAERFDAQIEGQILYSFLAAEGPVMKAIPSKIVDLSLTGCLVEASPGIPVGEVLQFQPTGDRELLLELQLMRSTPASSPGVPPGAPLTPPSLARYGARFTKKLSARDLRRLQEVRIRAS